MRIPVPDKVILPRETSPLVRTPWHAPEELTRFGRLMDPLVSLQILGRDKPFAAVYADVVSGGVRASMVAARVSRQHTVTSRNALLCWPVIGREGGRTYFSSNLEAKVLLQFSQASLATNLKRDRGDLRSSIKCTRSSIKCTRANLSSPPSWDGPDGVEARM